MLKSLILTFINDHLLFYLNKTDSSPIFQQIYPKHFSYSPKTYGNPNSTTSTQSQNLDNKSSNWKFNARCTKGITTSRILICDGNNWDKNAAQWWVTRLNTRDNCIWNLPMQIIGKKPQQQADIVHLSESQKGETKWSLRRTTSQSKNIANVFITHLGW
jgi:hypothetical protein